MTDPLCHQISLAILPSSSYTYILYWRFFMTRISKQGKDRHVSPRRPKAPSKKTGPKRDALPFGHKPHENALVNSLNRFIPKIG